MRRNEFDAEAALVACVLRDSGCYWQVADVVALEDFQQSDLRAVWSTVVDQVRAGKPADAVTIGDVNDSLAELAIDLASRTAGTVANVRVYADLVGRRSQERRVRQAGQRIANLTGDDVLGEAQKIMATCVPRSVASVAPISKFAALSMADIVRRSAPDAVMPGVPSGYEELDALTGGWQPSDLIIVAARPSVGKTAFALQSALHAAAKATPTMFVSLEMSGKQLSDRALSHLGGVNSLHIRDSSKLEDWEWPALSDAHAKLDRYPFQIDETGYATVEAIAARVRQVNAAQRLGLVVIDYLTYIQPPKADKVADAVQIITRGLKGLAKELNLPVVLLSQLNRDGEGEPELRHLRDSGAIEQDADVVIFLHRPSADDRDLIKVKIGKQRNGPLGEFYVRADMARMRFDSTVHEPPRRSQSVDFRSMKRAGAGRADHAAAAAGERA